MAMATFGFNCLFLTNDIVFPLSDQYLRNVKPTKRCHFAGKSQDVNIDVRCEDWIVFVASKSYVILILAVILLVYVILIYILHCFSTCYLCGITLFGAISLSFQVL